jgi:dTDP-4-amino-4,6-dideoxygalactose transaminase
LPSPEHDTSHANHLFVLRAHDRASLVRALEGRQIGYGLHYPKPVHLMPAYAFLGYTEGQLPETEEACRQVLSLPLYDGLRREEIAAVVQAVVSAT